MDVAVHSTTFCVCKHYLSTTISFTIFFGAPPFPLIITGEQQFRYNQKGDWKRKRHEERLQTLKGDTLEQFQQFGKPTWHPYNFGKTRKIVLQQFGKPTWQK
jgi:hypothetical protein